MATSTSFYLCSVAILAQASSVKLSLPTPSRSTFGMAFEDKWASIKANSYSICACCCAEHACASACDPIILVKAKVFCFKTGISSGQECIGEKGCVAGIQKLCCCLTTCSANNLALGCCDVFCCGRPYGEGARVGDHESKFMEGVHWCCYCFIAGWGCTQPLPMCATDTKCLCIEEKSSTAPCWTPEGGCIQADAKVCCCVDTTRLPPTSRIGLGCCGLSCCKRDGGDPSKATEAPPQLAM